MAIVSADIDVANQRGDRDAYLWPHRHPAACDALPYLCAPDCQFPLHTRLRAIFICASDCGTLLWCVVWTLRTQSASQCSRITSGHHSYSDRMVCFAMPRWLSLDNTLQRLIIVVVSHGRVEVRSGERSRVEHVCQARYPLVWYVSNPVSKNTHKTGVSRKVCKIQPERQGLILIPPSDKTHSFPDTAATLNSLGHSCALQQLLVSFVFLAGF